MSFTPNPEFENQLKAHLSERLAELTNKLARASRKVIEDERYWEGWTVTNPIRDIVDTNTLNESMQIEKISDLHYRISWATPYVTYVYFGYTTRSGRQIPARKWVEIAIDENDWDDEAIGVSFVLPE